MLFANALSGSPVHEQITEEALSFLKPEILRDIKDDLILTDANPLSLLNPANHFDGCNFSASAKALNQAYSSALAAAARARFGGSLIFPVETTDSFGQIIHAVQDFYSHTNWVESGAIGLVESGSGLWDSLEPFRERASIAESARTPLPAPFSVVLVQAPVPPGTTVSRDLRSEGPPFKVDVFNGSMLYRGIVSGTFGDHRCPAGVDIPHDVLAKDTSASSSYFTAAVARAMEQTRHEFYRLVKLVQATAGNETATDLIRAWVKPDAFSQQQLTNLFASHNDLPPSATRSLQQVLEELLFGVQATVTQSDSIAATGLGRDVPLFAGSLGDAMNAGDRFAQPFEVIAGPGTARTTGGSLFNASDSESVVRQRLEDRGFDVQRLDTTPDANGDLVRIRSDIAWNPTRATLEIGGSTGFDYFDSGVTGSLEGSLSAAIDDLTLSVTFGVAVLDGKPMFYIADSTTLSANVSGSGRATGELGIGALADVQVRGNLEFNAGAALRFDDPDNDGKIRLADLQSNLANTVIGDIDGSVHFSDVEFVAQLPIIPDIRWNGNFQLEIRDGRTTPIQSDLTPPSASTVLVDMARGFFNVKNGVPLLGQLADGLGRKLPIVNNSLAELLGFANELGWLLQQVNLTDGELVPTAITQTLLRYGITHNINQATVDQLIRGERVDLLTFRQHGDFSACPFGQQRVPPDEPVNFHCEAFRERVLSLGLPGIISVDLEVFGGVKVGWGYDIGLGIDTTGFYFAAPNALPFTDSGAPVSCPNDGHMFYAYAHPILGLEGNLKLFEFLDLASASGTAGFCVVGALDLYDPTPDGRIYLREIFSNGDNLAQSFLDALEVSLTGTLTLDVKASFLFWSA